MDLGLRAPSLLPTTSWFDRGDRPGVTRPSTVHRPGATRRAAVGREPLSPGQTPSGAVVFPAFTTG